MNCEKQVSLTAAPRESVEVTLHDGRIICGPRGLAICEFLKALPEWENPPIVGAVVNGELRELTFPVTIDVRVKPVSMADPDGALIYRRSLVLLLEAAFDKLFAPAHLTVEHSVSSGGYYCEVHDREPLTEAERKLLNDEMSAMVAMDMPLERNQVQLAEAIEYFTNHQQLDKVALLKYRQKDHLVLYTLGELRDYHHGYMVPSTRYLKWFTLTPWGDGFILQFPRRHAPDRIGQTANYPKLLTTFEQYGRWLARLGVEYTASLNNAIETGRIREIVLVSEALHEQRVAEIARQVLERSGHSRIVLIAGPSSSGKTTFSKRLAVQLLAQGISPVAIELDNYFVNRVDTPRDEHGQYDFEVLDALNRQRLSHDLAALAAGEEVQLPRYDFKAGVSVPGEVVRLKKDEILILEGIHGLNPNLIPDIPSDQMYKIYISCLTQLNLDSHNRISTTDTRLLRRIVRDSRERGYSAQNTIQRWESVRRGEKRHIFPFQENADVMFNSALVYELAALKAKAEPALRQVPYGTPEHIEAKRLLTFLEWFLPLDPTLIPDNSLLLEFLGGSILKDFR